MKIVVTVSTRDVHYLRAIAESEQHVGEIVRAWYDGWTPKNRPVRFTVEIEYAK